MNRLALMVLKNIFILPEAYLKLCHYANHTNEYTEEVKYKHIQYIFKRAIKAGNINLEIYGIENIPNENGFLMYANHQGLFDIMAITASLDKPWAAVVKKELYKIHFMKQILDCTKSIPIDREDIRQSMQVIQATAIEVQKGRNYLIFPEGTRSKKGNQMLEFHSGSFKCAKKAKCSILPIALIDSYKVLDQKGSRQVKVQIHYLEPIPYDEYKELNTIEIAKMVRSRIEKKVCEKEYYDIED